MHTIVAAAWMGSHQDMDQSQTCCEATCWRVSDEVMVWANVMMSLIQFLLLFCQFFRHNTAAHFQPSSINMQSVKRRKKKRSLLFLSALPGGLYVIWSGLVQPNLFHQCFPSADWKNVRRKPRSLLSHSSSSKLSGNPVQPGPVYSSV